MKAITPRVVPLVILFQFFFVGCDDNPMKSESGTISGVVDFSGTWPKTGSISISLNTSWPEVTGAPYAFKTIVFGDLSIDSLLIYRFENVTFGIYQGIIISWKDPTDNSSATNQHVIGGYGVTADTDFENAKSVMVSVSDYEITDINFTAHLDLIVETVPAESGTISGEVTFSGNWPTGTIFISLNSLWPLQTSPNYYSTIASKNLTDSKYSYSFENITFGAYIIAVIWLNPNGSWDTLGAYGSVTSPDFEDAELVTITATDFELTGLDFTATFSD